MRYFLMAFFALLLLGTRARADIFILQDGNTIEGDVVEENDAEITIQGRFGKTKIKRADIREIQKKKSPHAQFVERLDDLQKSDKKEDKDAWLDLGRFAKTQGVRDDIQTAYNQVLKFDPSNEEAHLALGHVRRLGSWITAEEKRKLDGGGAADAGANNNAQAANNDPKPAAGAGGPSQTGALGFVDTKSGSSKRVDCSGCGGTGYSAWFDCKQCKRSGKPGWLNMGEHMEMCGTCHGKGKLPGVPCKQCGGTGKVDPEKPSTPMGKPIPAGYEQCGGCGGTGYETWNPCNQCKRSPQPGYLDMNGVIQVCTRCMGYGKMPGIPCAKCNTTGFVRKP
ncbi:MAG: hypothetical protein HY291_09100 [Planctomycetes bacterium]|nr:hypothetical protein [Planctomycetota bacterium]